MQEQVLMGAGWRHTAEQQLIVHLQAVISGYRSSDNPSTHQLHQNHITVYGSLFTRLSPKTEYLFLDKHSILILNTVHVYLRVHKKMPTPHQIFDSSDKHTHIQAELIWIRTIWVTLVSYIISLKTLKSINKDSQIQKPFLRHQLFSEFKVHVTSKSISSKYAIAIHPQNMWCGSMNLVLLPFSNECEDIYNP